MKLLLPSHKQEDSYFLRHSCIQPLSSKSRPVVTSSLEHVTGNKCVPKVLVPHYMGCKTSDVRPHRTISSNGHTLIYILIHGFTLALFFLNYLFIYLTSLLEYNCFTMVCFCFITK